jgi:DNA invertase Pin-like site-specific DNA recombinase
VQSNHPPKDRYGGGLVSGRLGRWLQDLVGFLSELRASRCELYLHQQGLDTSTPVGRTLFGMLSVFADFERAMILSGPRRA